MIRYAKTIARLVLSGMALLAIAAPSPAQSINARGDGPLPAAEGDLVWAAAQKLPYAPQGDGPAFYVVAYSTCPYMAAFFHDWNHDLNGVQARWVFYAVNQGGTADNTADVAATRDPNVVQGILLHSRKSPAANSRPELVAGFRLATDGVVELNRIFASFHHYQIISPTFIWKTGDQVFVARGYDKQFFARVILPTAQRGK